MLKVVLKTTLNPLQKYPKGDQPLKITKLVPLMMNQLANNQTYLNLTTKTINQKQIFPPPKMGVKE